MGLRLWKERNGSRGQDISPCHGPLLQPPPEHKAGWSQPAPTDTRGAPPAPSSTAVLGGCQSPSPGWDCAAGIATHSSKPRTHVDACAASPNQPSRALKPCGRAGGAGAAESSAGTLPWEHTGHRMNIKDCLPARGVATPRYGNTRVVCTRMGEDGKPTGLEISGGSQIRAHAAAASISSSSAAPCAPCSMQPHVPPRAAVGNENTGVRGEKNLHEENRVFHSGFGGGVFVCLLAFVIMHHEKDQPSAEKTKETIWLKT